MSSSEHSTDEEQMINEEQNTNEGQNINEEQEQIINEEQSLDEVETTKVQLSPRSLLKVILLPSFLENYLYSI